MTTTQCWLCLQPIHYGYAYVRDKGRLFHDDPCFGIYQKRREEGEEFADRIVALSPPPPPDQQEGGE